MIQVQHAAAGKSLSFFHHIHKVKKNFSAGGDCTSVEVGFFISSSRSRTKFVDFISFVSSKSLRHCVFFVFVFSISMSMSIHRPPPRSSINIDKLSSFFIN